MGDIFDLFAPESTKSLKNLPDGHFLHKEPGAVPGK
jgi:hypothetical protein